MEDGEEDESRGLENASSSSLQPNSKPNRVTKEQFSKFQELQRRRLQIKSRSKIRKNTKGFSSSLNWGVVSCEKVVFNFEVFTGKIDATGKSQLNHLNTSNEVNEAEHSRLSNSDVDFGEKSSLVQHDKTKTTLPSKKLHKLHWGLDTKEPWERKANM
ncbi:uncharacterized protein LOC101215509 isoform X2 [Cucumis sativus]|uniref:uncharacterized protein LOC101215509 isoform X2 n=1 Tax=Cucumis sativus TaxID=3659 RepID=UPI0005ECB565|nr:uncharacterized protein LOC101215509 isoform X2 [Cucumis sativus]XP_011649923.1 uncharacterized protein LOC101215509 isoform X2 [Cucumis sativus]